MGNYRRRRHSKASSRRRRDLRKQALDVAWTPAMDAALKALQDACVVCGSTRNLTVDHVRPLSLGHGLVPGNAARLCGRCNAKKNNKELGELPPEMRLKIIAAAEEFEAHWQNRSQ